MPTIAILNRTSVLRDELVRPVVAALQTQVTRDFAPIWGRGADLVFVPSGALPPAGAWQLVLADTSDEAGALGYHDFTHEGLPLGKVGVKTSMADGGRWEVTASHEVLEILADPDIIRCVFIQRSARSGLIVAYEVCDAVEADQLGYDIGGIPVSDFVTPEWFESGRPPGVAFSFRKNVAAPLTLARGGYISVFRVGRSAGWTQVTAKRAEHLFDALDDPEPAHPASYLKLPRLGSRRERRSRARDFWMNSRAPSLEPS